ncbi:hypothetical protein ACFL2O_07625 [Thermodesulfobacteriota bacterium]
MASYKTRLINKLSKFINARRGVLALEFASSQGLGAKLEWCLETMAYCDEKGLTPCFKFSSPGSARNVDYFGSFFRIRGQKEKKFIVFSKIYHIRELNFKTNYDKLLDFDSAAHLINKYLAVRQEIIDEVDEFIFRNIGKDKNTLGIHCRGTDKTSEAPKVPYSKVKENVDLYLKKYPETDILFVSSDDMNFINYMEKEIKGLPVVYRKDSFRAEDDQAIHTTPKLNVYDINRDAVVNCLILSRCNVLMKTASILSGWSKLFNPQMPVIMLNRPYNDWFPERDLVGNEFFKPV